MTNVRTEKSAETTVDSIKKHSKFDSVENLYGISTESFG